MQTQKPDAEHKPTKGLYQKIESWRYTVGRIRSISMLALLFTLLSAAFSFWNVVNKNTILFSQLHGVPFVDNGSPPPTQYWTMDWIMSPMRVYAASGPAWVQTAVARNVCLENDGVCNPMSWQLQNACVKDPSTIVGNELYVPPAVLDEQAYFYKNTKTKFRHLQPLFTCIAEKIGMVSLFLNNEHSYSIGSTHSVHVLVTGVFIILSIILFSMLLGAVDKEKAPAHDNRQRCMFITAFVLAYTLDSYYIASSRAANPDQNEHHSIGLASYSYTFFYIVMTLFIFNQSAVFDDHANETARFARDKAERNGTKPPIPAAKYQVEGGLGYKGQSELVNNAQPGVETRQATLSVRGFVREPWHFDDRIKTSFFDRADKNPAANQITLDICDYINIPVHSKYVYGQYVTLPLVVLAFFMHRRNFGIDAYCQLVFVCAWIICLVDLFLYRMWWAFQIHKGVTFYNEQDKSEYKAMGLITLVGVLFQFAAYLVLMLSTLFPTSYIVVMSLYFGFTVLLKFFLVISITKNIDYNGMNNTQFSIARSLNTFDKFVGLFQKVDYLVFIGYLFTIAITLWVCIIMDDDREFTPEWMKDTKMTDRWGTGWQEYHSVM